MKLLTLSLFKTTNLLWPKAGNTWKQLRIDLQENSVFDRDCFRRIIVNEQAETLNKISTVAQLQLRKE